MLRQSGPDSLPGRILQRLASEIALVLHCIYVHLFNTGVLPVVWTIANVAPIFKKGSKELAVNYRQVSLRLSPVSHVNC